MQTKDILKYLRNLKYVSPPRRRRRIYSWKSTPFPSSVVGSTRLCAVLSKSVHYAFSNGLAAHLLFVSILQYVDAETAQVSSDSTDQVTLVQHFRDAIQQLVFVKLYFLCMK
jgi:hypothetical protein